MKHTTPVIISAPTIWIASKIFVLFPLSILLVLLNRLLLVMRGGKGDTSSFFVPLLQTK